MALKTKCAYVFGRGKNAGKTCTANATIENFCKRHYRGTADVLPQQVYDTIVSKLFSCSDIDGKHARLACVLEQTCKAFATAITNNDIFQKLKFSLVPRNIDLPSDLTTKQQIQLYARNGCQICDKSRIRKVYEEYGVRCCEECLQSHTLSDYVLKTKYKIKDLNIFTKAKKRRVEMYNPYGGAWRKNYTLTFYWKEDVEEIVSAMYNCSLDELVKEIRAKTKQHNMTLMTRILSHNSYVTVEDIEKRTPFFSVSTEEEMKAHNVHKYVTQAKEKKRLEEIQTAFDSFGLNQHEIPSRIIKKSNGYACLLANYSPITKEQIDCILEEVRTIQYEEYFSRFSANFGESFRFVKNSKLVIERKNKCEIFTEEDKNTIQHTIQKMIAERTNAYISFDGLYYRCNICDNKRTFCQEGVRQHCRDKHKIDFGLFDIELTKLQTHPI